ncbi:ABC transporter permease [Vallitalea maricola]|uniref:Polygalacturonan/rhamnogalacturonan ABC transporter permease n=1 Tax=Vallitalea maricola TaxID=3074433 RepID=A0ACB5UFA1_9FIRM|nr:polygalacturonan/rhamnogalacturonan ABC transporter permease [Vallitalea sp. AN17-2]
MKSAMQLDQKSIRKGKPVKRRVDKNRIIKNIVKYKQLYLMMLPGILILFIFKYVPMFGIVVAFKNYLPAKGFLASEWVGLEHFKHLFLNSPEFINVFKNTLIISFYKLVIGFPIPIMLAILINELRYIGHKRTIQTLIYLPHFLSWVIFGGIVYNVLALSGPVNTLLQSFGFEPIMFMTKTNMFRGIIVGSSIFKDSGWGTVVYLAAIVGVNPTLYEAAVVDGANRFQRIWHVTLPAIKGTIIVLLILRIGRILDVGFQQILVLYNPIVYNVADVFGTFVYRVGINQGNYSFATAAGLFKGVVGFILVRLANKLSKKMGEAGVW